MEYNLATMDDLFADMPTAPRTPPKATANQRDRSRQPKSTSKPKHGPKRYREQPRTVPKSKLQFYRATIPHMISDARFKNIRQIPAKGRHLFTIIEKD